MQDTFVVAPFVLLTAFMFILMSAIVFTIFIDLHDSAG